MEAFSDEEVEAYIADEVERAPLNISQVGWDVKAGKLVGQGLSAIRAGVVRIGDRASAENQMRVLRWDIDHLRAAYLERAACYHLPFEGWPLPEGVRYEYVPESTLHP